MNDRLKAMLNPESRLAPLQPVSPTLVKSGATTAEADEEEVVGATYGFVRGIRDRAVALEFRLLDSNPFPEENPAGEYAMLTYRAWLRDGTGFRLEYLSGLRVTVRGRGVRPLYERLLLNRVLWVQEEGQDPIAEKAEAASLRIYRIELLREQAQTP